MLPEAIKNGFCSNKTRIIGLTLCANRASTIPASSRLPATTFHPSEARQGQTKLAAGMRDLVRRLARYLSLPSPAFEDPEEESSGSVQVSDSPLLRFVPTYIISDDVALLEPIIALIIKPVIEPVIEITN